MPPTFWIYLGDDDKFAYPPEPKLNSPKYYHHKYRGEVQKNKVLQTELDVYKEILDAKSKNKDIPNAVHWLWYKVQRQAAANQELQLRIEKLKEERKNLGSWRMTAFLKRIDEVYGRNKDE